MIAHQKIWRIDNEMDRVDFWLITAVGLVSLPFILRFLNWLSDTAIKLEEKLKRR